MLTPVLGISARRNIKTIQSTMCFKFSASVCAIILWNDAVNADDVKSKSFTNTLCLFTAGSC